MARPARLTPEQRYQHQRNAIDRWKSNNPDRVLSSTEKYRLKRTSDFEAFKRHRITALKSRCKSNGVDCDIDVDDLLWNTTCPVLGIELQWGACGQGAKDNSMSFDRIDPNKGYVKGNVIVVSNRANRIRNNATVQELRMIAEYYDAL